MKNTLFYRKIIKTSEGYVFVAALLAMFIMTAIGILIFSLTSHDMLTTAKLMGEKRALNAAETGVHELLQQMATNAGDATKVTTTRQSITVTSGNQIKTDYYTLSMNAPPADAIKTVTKSSFQIGGTGTQSERGAYNVTNFSVLGESGDFGGRVIIDVGIGYGPVDLSTNQPGSGS
jgi:Tfp pilus assembly protein PilX